MERPGSSDWRAEMRAVTVIVRLTVDGTGNLRYGEVVDLDGVIRDRFSAWCDLAPLVRATVAEDAHSRHVWRD